MASARRISGSASPSRLVACSNRARLLRRDRDVRMVLAEACLVDGERAAHQRFRLAEPVGGLQQQGEVVEVARDVWMVLAKACLVDGERAAHQRFRLAEPIGRLHQLGEVVDGVRDVRMVLAEACLGDGDARGDTAVPPRRAGW